jgi:hypothetical protein
MNHFQEDLYVTLDKPMKRGREFYLSGDNTKYWATVYYLPMDLSDMESAEDGFDFELGDLDKSIRTNRSDIRTLFHAEQSVTDGKKVGHVVVSLEIYLESSVPILEYIVHRPAVVTEVFLLKLLIKYTAIWRGGRVVGNISPDNILVQNDVPFIIDDWSLWNEMKNKVVYNYARGKTLQSDIYAFAKTVQEIVGAREIGTLTVFLKIVRSSAECGQYTDFKLFATEFSKSMRQVGQVRSSMTFQYLNIMDLALLSEHASHVYIAHATCIAEPRMLPKIHGGPIAERKRKMVDNIISDQLKNSTAGVTIAKLDLRILDLHRPSYHAHIPPPNYVSNDTYRDIHHCRGRKRKHPSLPCTRYPRQ